MKKIFEDFSSKQDHRPFCMHCHKRVGYKIETKPTALGRDATTLYDELIAICCRCGHEIYVPLINDLNCEARSTRGEKIVLGIVKRQELFAQE